MFDLDREVAAWSAALQAGRCSAVAHKGAAELADHLYCEIESGRAAGLSDEAAFRAATARLGGAPALTAENAKNRSVFGTVCRVAAKLDGPLPTDPEHRRLLLAHAVIWAALMIASSLVLKKTGGSETSGLLLTVVFIPLWQASDRILRRVLRKRSGSADRFNR
jgi:hypothetical protein